MFIKELSITNYRLFPSDSVTEINDINVPDGINPGTGMTVIVGENGCGKTSLLDAMALPILSYKSDGISVNDFNNPEQTVTVELISDKNFTVAGTMPKGSFQSKGFIFEAKVRARGNKSYLSSIVVSDQKFVKADGEEKPKDGSPDLRVNVNNPFKGQRFDENDIIFLDKNRTYQIRSGTYNPTRFDRLMEDFDYQYIKNQDEIENLNDELQKKITVKENEFLTNAIKKFEEISGTSIALHIIDNYRPFSKGFFAERKDNNLLVNINMLGSGYEMFFSLIYSFYLAKQSGKQLIALIDEPELHMHPTLQNEFVNFLLEISKESQIILASHSPLLVKQLSYNEYVRTCVFRRNDGIRKLEQMDKRILPYVSANEINYLAFDLATEEYHNELYEELKYLKGDNKTIKDFDVDYFQTEKAEAANYPWKGHQNEVSLHTFIRNQIHHSKDNGKPAPQELMGSIQKMGEYLKELI